jgi:ABC-type sugar transport system ATPase subunit
VLTESEAEQLVQVMKSIAASGIAIIFITHRLDEVMAAADNITILRDGRLAATRAVGETTLAELAELMIGRSGEGAEQMNQRPADESAPIALKLSHLKVKMPGEAVADVNLNVRKGEILGIGGLAGQGKVGIPNGVMGLYPAEGQAELFGEALPLNDAGAALHKGMAMVSEDRRGVGLLLEESIEDNIVFNAMQINGRFLKPMLPDCTKLRKSWPKLLLILLLTAACLAFGFYGDSQWPDAAGTPAAVDETIEDAALPDAEVVEEIALDEEIVVDDSVPVVARISPLFLILGFVGVAALAYIALYPLVHGWTDRILVKDHKAVRAYADQMVQELDIRCRGPQQHAGTLSGGNQQKVCIARALALNPQFLFVSEPTRGIDVGAKRLVLETLIRLNREQGMTIVMVSSELLELRSICDRIAIVSDGEVVDIFPADAPDVDIGLAMSGIKAEGQKGGAAS